MSSCLYMHMAAKAGGTRSRCMRPTLSIRLWPSTRCRLHTLQNGLLVLTEEVHDALMSGKPVVALESAIITHGMPSTINLETAISLEKIVHSTGCVPATIGLLSGRIHVGLTRSELQHLADTGANPGFVKVSRRDLGPAMSQRRTGGTTIAGTMLIAHLAGIRFFGTGGLGGVHRGGENSLDVSADLTELGRTPVAVIAAGAKAILDIGRTLEYLETQGVPVVTYGPTDDFPAFYSPQSGFKSPWHVSSPMEAAKIVYYNQLLNLGCGTFFGVPIPQSHAAAGSSIQEAVETAVQESVDNGMSKRGKEVTPWLLRRVAELSGGCAIHSNIALIENAVLAAGRIALEYYKLLGEEQAGLSYYGSVTSRSRVEDAKLFEDNAAPSDASPPVEVIVIGAAAMDMTAQPKNSVDFVSHSTHPGTVRMTLGGVARNMAEAAHLLLNPYDTAPSTTTLLLSVVGEDVTAQVIRQGMISVGQRVDGLIERPTTSSQSNNTAVCNMILDKSGGLIGGVADMGIIETLEASEVVAILDAHHPKLVAFDGNIPSELMQTILRHCSERNIATFFEPTSVAKCVRILPAVEQMLEHSRPALTFISPNQLELKHMYESGRSSSSGLFASPYWWEVIDAIGLDEQYRNDMLALSRLPGTEGAQPGGLEFLVRDGVAQMAVHLLPFVRNLFIKLGHLGVLVVMRMSENEAVANDWRTVKTSMSRRLVAVHRTSETLILQHFAAHIHSGDATSNVTGAGDSLVGALLAGLLRLNGRLTPQDLAALIRVGQEAAVLSMQSDLAVAPNLRSLAGKSFSS